MCLSSGREYQKNDPAVTVDYNTADPVVRWDSYENFNQRYQDSLEGKTPALLFSSRPRAISLLPQLAPRG